MKDNLFKHQCIILDIEDFRCPKYRFLFLCFGSEESSETAKTPMKGLEDYLFLVKDVYRFKVNEKKRKENFLKGVNS